MITLRYEYTAEDYLKAMKLHMQLRPWQKYLLIFVVSLCLVRVVPIILSGASLIDVLKSFMPLVWFGVLYILIYVLLPRGKVRRIFAQQKSLHRSYETVISPDAITTTFEHGRVTMPIADYYKYKVGKDCVLLYQSQVLFSMFPRRCFASDSDFDTFISYLENHLVQTKP